MSFQQTHEMQLTPQEYVRELKLALDHCDIDQTGNPVVVRDQNRKVMIDLEYDGKRHLGSLNLPMTEVKYDFDGYTEQEAEEFMTRLSHHMMRGGGG